MSLKQELASNIVVRIPLKNGTVKDLGPNSTDATFSGSPFWSNGPRGKAISIKADGQSVDVADTSNVNAAAGSVSGWFKNPMSGATNYYFSVGGDDFSVLTGGVGTNIRAFHDNVQVFNIVQATHGALENEWFHMVVTYATSGNVVLYINGVEKGSGAAAVVNMDPTGFITIGNSNQAAAFESNGETSGDFTVWNIALSEAQISQLYQESLQEANLTHVPTATRLPESSTIPVEPDNLAAHWDMKLGGTTVNDLSGNGNDATIAIYGSSDAEGIFGRALDGNGSTGRLTVADQTAIQNIFDSGGSASYWIKPRSDGGSNNGMVLAKGTSRWLSQVFGEASGFVKVNLSVDFSGTDGLWATTGRPIALNFWNHVVITYDSDSVANNPTMYINGEAFTVGGGLTETTTPVGTRVSDVGSVLNMANSAADINAFDGLIEDVRLYTDTLTAAEATALYEAGQSKLDLNQTGEDWEVSTGNVTSGFLENTGWTVDSGTWQVRDGTSGKGALALAANSRIYKENRGAFGTWKFGLNKGADANFSYVQFIQNGTPADLLGANNTGYVFYINSLERLYLARMNGGSNTELFYTAASYVSFGVDYEFTITRSAAGSFSAYIKGGAFTDWTLIVIDGDGLGSNPVTSTTYTASERVLADLDNLDGLASSFKYYPTVIDPTA